MTFILTDKKSPSSHDSVPKKPACIAAETTKILGFGKGP